VLLAVLCAACGGDDTSSSAGGDADAFPDSNGCDPASPEDHTGDTADVEVDFGASAGNQNVYTPACVKIKAGQKLVYKGNFVAHYLTGGTASKDGETPDGSSPIPKTESGTEVTVAFPAAGTFPYYCQQHGTLGMKGAVFAE